MTGDPGSAEADPAFPLRPVRAVAFDFDGTLADSFPQAASLVPRLAREFRFRDPGTEGIARLRELPTGRILSELGISRWKVPLVLWRARTLLASSRSPIPLFPGVADLLHDLDRAGVEWGILTTNGLDLVRRTLRHGGAPEPGWLEAGLGLSGKAARLRGMARALGVPPAELVLVADETRDLEAARKVGAPMVAATWGYATREALERAGARRFAVSVVELRPHLLGEGCAVSEDGIVA